MTASSITRSYVNIAMNTRLLITLGRLAQMAGRTPVRKRLEARKATKATYFLALTDRQGYNRRCWK